MLQNLLFWSLLLAFLLPLILAGITVVRRIYTIDRFELLLPVGGMIGLSLYILCLNLVAFLIKGTSGIIFSYVFIISLALFFYFKTNLLKISWPKGKSLYFYILSILGWGIFLIWKSNNALIGSDSDLYYSVAHTFIKGNFPPLTPWQPSIPLSYHLGATQLLGAFYFFSNLSFQFLHIFFSFLFILFTSQMIIWLWKRHDDLTSFIFSNLTALIFLVSFGFIKIIMPSFPLHLPQVSSINQLFIWIRNLPTVNQSIEVYGAPINLDGLIYFIHHSFGIALSLALLVLITSRSIKKVISLWIILSLGIGTLSIINESLFITVAPALFFGMMVNEIYSKSLFKNLKTIILSISIIFILITVPGGMVNNQVLNGSSLEKSVLVFPKKEDIKEEFIPYHYYQQISKLLPQKKEWGPFLWFHVGVDLMLAICLIIIAFAKFNLEQKRVVIILFLIGVFSLIAYNFIVPKFLIANGNRFLAFSFLFLSLAISFFLQNLILCFKEYNLFKKILLLVVAGYIILPTIIPPLFLLSKNRFSDNKLIPTKEQKSSAIEWVEKNLSLDNKIMVLDLRAPHPSGQTRAMVQAGVFAPVFSSGARSYTIEASPEYTDVAYYLSPLALKVLKIDTVFIDSVFFETLPQLRKTQLLDNRYFEEIFKREYENKTWERIVKIKPDYLNPQNEINGTISELENKFDLQGKVYIDSEKNFEPSFIRRPIIFSLREHNLYFSPESGVYLNVEADINMHDLTGVQDFNYMVLSKSTDPKLICHCNVELLWKGLRDKVYLWHRVSN